MTKVLLLRPVYQRSLLKKKKYFASDYQCFLNLRCCEDFFSRYSFSIHKIHEVSVQHWFCPIYFPVFLKNFNLTSKENRKVFRLFMYSANWIFFCSFKFFSWFPNFWCLLVNVFLESSLKGWNEISFQNWSKMLEFKYWPAAMF